MKRLPSEAPSATTFPAANSSSPAGRRPATSCRRSASSSLLRINPSPTAERLRIVAFEDGGPGIDRRVGGADLIVKRDAAAEIGPAASPMLPLTSPWNLTSMQVIGAFALAAADGGGFPARGGPAADAPPNSPPAMGLLSPRRTLMIRPGPCAWRSPVRRLIARSATSIRSARGVAAGDRACILPRGRRRSNSIISICCCCGCLIFASAKRMGCWNCTSMTSVCSRCVGPTATTDCSNVAFRPSKFIRRCQRICIGWARAERLPLEVAVHEDVHLAGAVDPKAVVAAVDVQVRAGQGHAAAFKVGRLPVGLSERPSEDVDHGARPVGVGHLQMIAGDEDGLLTRLGDLRLADADVFIDVQLGQFAPPCSKSRSFTRNSRPKISKWSRPARPAPPAISAPPLGRHWAARAAGQCLTCRGGPVSAESTGDRPVPPATGDTPVPPAAWPALGGAGGWPALLAGAVQRPAPADARPGAAGWNHASNCSTAPESCGEFIFTLPRANIRSG